MPHPAPPTVPEARRTVLVTGAAKRLGRDMALHLAARGWNVAVHYRNSHEDALKTVADCAHQSSASGTFDAFFADLADESSVRALWTAVVARFGTVDAVVNSASTFEHDTAQTFGYAALHTHLAANTAAAVVLAQCLHAHRLGLSPAPPQAGVVVNLLDQKLWNPNPDFFSYTLSKAALEAANTLLAQALAPQVRVVGVAPGLTLTSHMLSQAEFEALHTLSPLGRSSTPADVAATVAFALDNRAITGTTLLVDGGQHLMKFDRDFSLMTPPPRTGPAMTTTFTPGSKTGTQTLTLTGLRFDANLGILEQEKCAPQPIQVDAELNQGTQPLLPADDDINHVLDYRKVRQIIIDECTAEHVNLLETLIGKLAHRLMQLPGVIGVRVKIAKLEIFDDCEVAIRMQSGQW